MGSSKRPQLAAHYSGPRAGPREAVSLDGHCRIDGGDECAVAILDLDTHGCRIRGVGGAVNKAAPLMIRFGDLPPRAARLRWAKRGQIGAAFAQPLTDEELAAAKHHARPIAAPTPLRRRGEPAG